MWPNLSLHITSFRLRAWYANTCERRNYPKPASPATAVHDRTAGYDDVAEALGLGDGLGPALGTALGPGDAVDSAG